MYKQLKLNEVIDECLGDGLSQHDIAELLWKEGYPINDVYNEFRRREWFALIHEQTIILPTLEVENGGIITWGSNPGFLTSECLPDPASDMAIYERTIGPTRARFHQLLEERGWINQGHGVDRDQLYELAIILHNEGHSLYNVTFVLETQLPGCQHWHCDYASQPPRLIIGNRDIPWEKLY